MGANLNLRFYTICIIACGQWCRAELFSAIADMEPLLETHKVAIDNLEAYLQKDTKRIDLLIKYLERFKKENATMNGPDYLANPINSFKLIKRLTVDVAIIERTIQTQTEYKRNTSLAYPDNTDLVGAALGLSRLQVTYQLSLTSMTNGFLKGFDTPLTSMSASDCFEVGRGLYKSKDYKNGVVWMKEAFNKYKSKEKEFYSFSKADIAEHISFGYHSLYDHKNALEWLKKLLHMRPGDPRYVSHMQSIDYFEDRINQEELEKQRRRKFGNTITKADLVDTLSPYDKLKNIYESACRDDKVVPDKVIKRLKCRYLKQRHPFLRIAPIKLEQLYIKPNIYLMHQVLNDKEVEYIKNLAKPKLARVLTDSCIGDHVANRTNKIAWLPDEESNILMSLSHRVSHFTGLSMKSSKPYEVANFGIGGHHEPHYDFCRNKTNLGLTGNTMATVLFYLSDVVSGGATVFAKLGVSVKPIKGSALFWFSLFPSGEGDLATNHGECPVIYGSKWVMNKYFHETGHEFIRPCNLKHQQEGYIHKIPSPRRRN